MAPDLSENRVRRHELKWIHNAQLDYAVLEARVCLRDGMKIASRSGERDRDRLRGFGISICKAQLTLLARIAKQIKFSDEEITTFLTALVDSEAEQTLMR